MLAAALRESADLVAILDRFLESTAGAAKKEKLVRKYAALMKKRFKAQRDWFLQHALPHLKHRLSEAHTVNPYSIREAESDDDVADAVSGLLDSWMDDPEVRKQFDQLTKAAQAAGVDYVEAVLSQDDFARALARVLVKKAGQAYQFGLDNPRAIKYLEEHAFEIVSKGLDETTRDGIKSILLDGLKEKQSYSEMAAAIRREFEDMSSYRSQMIATYEIGNAYVGGTKAAAEDIAAGGIEMEKAWLTVGDDRVSEECEENEQAGWIDLDEDFPSGDDAPLAHPNCRCALQVRKVPAVVAA